MTDMILLSFKPEITWRELPDNEGIVLQSSDRKLTFNRPTAGLRLALATLHSGSVTKQELNRLVQEADNICGLLSFNSHLSKLINLGWICHGINLATAVPLAKNYQFTVVAIEPNRSFVLSRFAYLHQIEKQMVLESPLSKSKVCLHDWRGAALIAKLARPQTIASLAEISFLTTEEIELFLTLLSATQMISIDAPDLHSESSEQETVLAQWDFHDLLFHTRSRQGRSDRAIGATYRFADTIEPLPAVKPQMSSKTISLYQPDLKQLTVRDISLTQALETRRSLRTYNDLPITAQQLGEFLYRTARVKQLVELEQGEYTSRPYPSGGGLYELELYPLINTCTGIERGFYHYDPLDHQLCQLSEATQDTERLLKDAWFASGKQDRPQVLIAIAARFPRLAWKYESVAYSLVLKHVGCLYQTMYLVATAMNLAPCALGSGNTDLFASVAGTNYYEESSVGEFMLGVLADKS